MDRVTLLTGDWVDMLKTLPGESVHCIVTSPPYYGLRDYGTAQWEGGDPTCDHIVGRFKTPCSDKQRSNRGSGGQQARHQCPKCGAYRIDHQLGLEATPEEYVAKLVEGFRELYRVLRNDGTLWLNLGDSYAGSNCGSNDHRERTGLGADPTQRYHGQKPGMCPDLKPKDLIGIPWRVAFALQADGWWLRSDIVWHKLNSMPESVKDRPTRAHEFVFLLAKSTHYYYDSEAVKEPVAQSSLKRACYGRDCNRPSTKNASMGGDGIHTDQMGARFVNPSGRNRRDVWTLPTATYKAAHFATFPPALVEPCILAGTSARGCCPQCGKPWKRILGIGLTACKDTIGWRPDCACDTGEPVPCTVLDPFAGGGTTLMVALQHGRNAIGIELNADYISLIKQRLHGVQLEVSL